MTPARLAEIEERNRQLGTGVVRELIATIREQNATIEKLRVRQQTNLLDELIGWWSCRHCGAMWQTGKPEPHGPKCIAAPEGGRDG